MTDNERDHVVSDFDQTNGLADGLEGDDGGTAGDSVLEEEGIAFDPNDAIDEVRPGDADADNGLTDEDADPAVTKYSEEG